MSSAPASSIIRQRGCSGGMATGVMLLSIIEMGVGVQLDRGGLVVVAATDVEVQLCSGCLVVECAAEVECGWVQEAWRWKLI